MQILAGSKPEMEPAKTYFHKGKPDVLVINGAHNMSLLFALFGRLMNTSIAMFWWVPKFLGKCSQFIIIKSERNKFWNCSPY